MKLLKRFFVLSAVLFMAVAAFASAPKYVFYFIGDGMGMTPSMASAAYKRVVLGDAQPPLMMTFPVAGQVMTFSASSPITDSAAAGTALSTGSKTKNGMLGMNADTVPVYSIANKFKENGYGIGIVTNVAADDATPGAFYAHVPARGMKKDIDTQFLTSGVDFLAGAALTGLTDKHGNSTGVKEQFAANNIRMVTDVKEIGNTKDRIVLVGKDPFQSGNIGYINDNIEGMITLPEMTAACMDYLKNKTPEKFFMMVEGGNIDHALHGNDGMTAIEEIYNFNNALQLAYDFMQAHPEETLIVVTADHDTGGLSLGNNSNGYTMHLDVLSHQKISKEMFSDMCKNMLDTNQVPTWPEMKALLTEKFGFWDKVKISEKETKALKEQYNKVFEKRSKKKEKTLYNDFNIFASDVYKLISKKAALGFTTGAHTGTFVPVYAAGVGSENFGRVLNNIEIPALILSIAGLDK